MSVNHYKPHLLVLPEDDANRQIANGFVLNHHINNQALQILNAAGGWMKVLDKFVGDHLAGMYTYPHRHLLLLLDFDDDELNRRQFMSSKIPAPLLQRVFALGVKSEPERLKTDSGKSYEKIGAVLAEECVAESTVLWSHHLLMHNQAELMRLTANVKPFLFQSA